jgi:hypothetical protein
MKMLILAAIAALGLGMASANAATNPHNPGSSQQGGDQNNYMRGGGG